MNYETSYTKGWSDKSDWLRFTQAIAEKDAYEIDRLIGSRETKAVDPDIGLCKSGDLELMRQYQTDSFVFGSEVHQKELNLLHDLAEMRDIPLEDDDNNMLPVGYRVVSWFLQDVNVPKYAAGVDYMTTEATWKAVQDGKTPLETQQVQGTTKILTGRDAAAYVHKDDPLIPWLNVAKTLLNLGVSIRVESDMVANGSQSRFASCGLPHIYGTLGETLKRLSPLSFREKWTKMVPRPEEAAPVVTGQLLPQTYVEGSPYHPSRNAMHYIAAAVLAEVLKMVFDKHHVLPSGRTVEKEIDLMRDNIGFWREWAGVHYASDNSPYLPRAKALAQKIVKERYG